MANTVIDATEFNCEIKYTAPKMGGAGGKSLNILNRKTNSRVNLSTPVMLTWGASDFVDPQTGKGNGKYEMSLQFPTDEYKNDELTAFLENMKKFEQKIKDDALIYSKEWFGKLHKSPEVVEALFTPMLKYSKDKLTGEPDLNKPPSLRVKLPIWEGVWGCEVYDDDGAKLYPTTISDISPVELIQKGTQVSVLMSCGGIWFANGKFGVTWKLVQAMVQKPKPTLSGQCFLKLRPSASREEQNHSPSPPALAIAPKATQPHIQVSDIASSVAVEDSDCDEEDEHEHSVSAQTQQIAEPEFGVASVQESNITTTTTQSIYTTEPKKSRKVVKKKLPE